MRIDRGGPDVARIQSNETAARLVVQGVIAAARGSSAAAAWSRRISRFRCPWPVTLLPIFLIVALGLTEIGSLIVQAAAVHEGLGVGASQAARSRFPLSAAARGGIENAIMTGTVDGRGPFLVSGWARAGANIQIQEITYRVAGSPLPAVRIVATVPYDPLLVGFLPISPFNLELSRDTAVVAE